MRKLLTRLLTIAGLTQGHQKAQDATAEKEDHRSKQGNPWEEPQPESQRLRQTDRSQGGKAHRTRSDHGQSKHRWTGKMVRAPATEEVAAAAADEDHAEDAKPGGETDTWLKNLGELQYPQVQRHLLTITDLTKMSGDRVCIAGIDSDGVCIRPVLPPPGILRKHLQAEDRTAIKPRAKIEFELLPTASAAPHTEDMEFEVDTWRYLGDCDDKEWVQLLDRDADPSIETIFAGALQEHKYVLPGEAPRSLGTVRAARVHHMRLFDRYQPPSLRLRFSDAAGVVYDLPINDLAYRERVTTRSAAGQETQALRSTPVLFLRVGLGRPWRRPGDPEERCWLQITGIYRTSYGTDRRQAGAVR